MQKLKQTLELADSIGRFIEYWGFKRIQGRLWTLVYLSAKPISTSQLVDLLGVSKGLVSVAINELVDIGLVARAEKGPGGGQTYVAQQDMGAVIRRILRDRELALLNNTHSCIDSMLAFSQNELDEAGLSKERLEQLCNLTLAHKSFLGALISQSYSSIAEWVSFVRNASKLIPKS